MDKSLIYLLSFGLFMLVIILVTFSFGVQNKYKKMYEPKQNSPTQTKTEKPSIIQNNQMNADDYIDVLNWMLGMNIISTEEYNKLVVKGMSYVK